MNLTDAVRSRSTRKKKKIVGRGMSSGCGKFCNRGMKGFYSRSGNRMNMTYEGGQMPLFRRLPQRGFNNKRFGTVYIPVNLFLLEKGFQDGETVTYDALKARGLVHPGGAGIKILGGGELTRKLTIHADGVSKSAREKIEKLGGTIILVGKSAKAKQAESSD